MTAADDLNMAIDALKERLKGVLEVIVMTSRKYLIDIFIGWPEDKYHGHIVITTRKEIKIIHNRAYGCRGYSCP